MKISTLMLSHKVRQGLFALSFLVAVTGYLASGLIHAMPVSQLGLYGLLLIAFLLISLISSRLFRLHATHLLLIVIVSVLAYFWGIGSVAAILLLMLSAYAMGFLVVPSGLQDQPAIVLVAGLIITATFIGWLLPFPVHTRGIYICALIVPILFARNRVLRAVVDASRSWVSVVDTSPVASFLVLGVVALASTFAWLPTVGYDSLAYHLILPTQLAQDGYYQMAAGTNVWALAPWASDSLQGLVRVLSGGDARGVLDALWFFLTLALVWQLCAELSVSRTRRWLAVALYASTPILAVMLVSMETEGPTAAVLAACALAVMRCDVKERRGLLLVAVLLGGLLALKVSNILFAAPMFLWLLWRCKGRIPLRGGIQAAVVGLLVMLPSYVYAYALSGNPFLPLFNTWFHSPYFPNADFHDKHWVYNSFLGTLWGMVFDSAHYIESAGPGMISFYPVALLGSLLVALANRFSRAMAMVGVVTFLSFITQLHYIRYPAPALALLIPAMLSGLPEEGAGSRVERGLVLGGLSILVLSGLAFLPDASWILKHNGLRYLLENGSAKTLTKYAPAVDIEHYVLKRGHPQDRILSIDPALPFMSALGGRGFVTTWYDAQLYGEIRNLQKSNTVDGWSGLFQLTGANLIVTADGSISPPLASALRHAGGESIYHSQGETLWQLHPADNSQILRNSRKLISVKFAMDDMVDPPGLLDASAEFRCDPGQASKGHIVFGWTVRFADNQSKKSYGWAYCKPDGQAYLSYHEPVSSKVTGVFLVIVNKHNRDMGLDFESGSAHVRRDLKARRDLALKVRSLF